MNSHLVTIEVGVECSTSQWVQLYSLTLNHLRLESLDTETVKCRSTVKHYRMTLHYILQDIPNNRFATINDLLSTLYSLYNTTLNQLTNDKWFVKFSSHQFRKTALTHLQLRTNDDYRTSRVVNTLTQQVLTETSLFTLQGVRKRLQRTVALTLNSRTLTRVIKQAVDSLLQHTLLITENHLRSLNFNQSLQTVITYDNTTIEVVEVRSSKTSTIQWHQWAKFRRSNRDNLHHHPLRAVDTLAGTESLYYLQTLQRLSLTLLAGVIAGTVTKFIRQRVEIYILQQLINRFCTHLGDKLIRIIVWKTVIIWAQLIIDDVNILILSKEVELV